MSFSNPLWNDLIIQRLLDIDKQISAINIRLDNMSNRLDNIEKHIFINKIEIKDVINDIIDNKITNNDINNDEEDDDPGEWMKVTKKYNKKRF
jgi:hypothetical protein